MPRRVPFSHKQKKEQLKERRKVGRQAEGEADGSAAKAYSTSVKEDPATFFLRFVNDSDAVTHQNKVRGYEKLGSVGHPTMFPIDQSVYMRTANCPDLPRRPPGARAMTKDDLEAAEKGVFDAFLRSVSPDMQTISTEFCMFEMNPNVYRQVWRVTERSDVLCVIADARFPLAHLPVSILRYAVAEGKPLIVVLNKADLMAEQFVDTWGRFIDRYVALHVPPGHYAIVSASSKRMREEKEDAPRAPVTPDFATESYEGSECENSGEGSASAEDAGSGAAPASSAPPRPDPKINHNRLRLGFVGAFVRRARELAGIAAPELITVGFLGQPSVGKSSLMNALYGRKIVSVKLTPGHTKYFQTYYMRLAGYAARAWDAGVPNPHHVEELAGETDRSFMLCDCPGLVFACRNAPRPLQIITGVFPTGRVREFFSPLRVLCEQVDGFKDKLVNFLNLGALRIRFPELVDKSCETPGDLLELLSYLWGFFTRGANPDAHRAGIQFFKRITDGSISYSIPPDFHALDAVAASHTAASDKHK